MAQKVTIEQATQEVQKWLDFKKVTEKARETYKDHIETLVTAITTGELVLEENMHLLHTLNFPITDEEGNPTVTVLDYKPRIQVGDTRSRLLKIKTGDTDGRIAATVATVAAKPTAIIEKMDTSDYSISQSVVVFFL